MSSTTGFAGHPRSRVGDAQVGHVLHDHIDLEVARGGVRCVVGGSGTGESVLLRSIMGLQTPAEGSIEVLGQDVARLDGDELVRLQVRWACCSRTVLFSDRTVAQNIRVPLREHTDLPQNLMCELTSVKLGMVDCRPIPHGEVFRGALRRHAQRAGLARALALDPRAVVP